LAPVPVVAAACLFPNPDALGGDASIPNDACCDVSADVAHEASFTDASDGGAPDASEAGYCAALGGMHAFCEDFDEGPFAANFTYTHSTANVSIGSNGLEYTSPPKSFFATVDAGSGTMDQGYLQKTLTTAQAATYSFDVRVDAWTGGKSAILAAFTIDEGLPTYHGLTLYTTDTYTSTEEVIPADAGFKFLDHAFSSAVPLGTWKRVSATVDFKARTCSVTLDGATVVPSTSLDPSWAPGVLNVYVGFTYVGGEAQGWAARWDNVVVDVAP
jgi:hypothetical protein